MNDTTTRPEWIAKGAEVVTFTTGRTRRYDRITPTAIARVSAKSFTVENGDRYDIDRQEHRRGGALTPTYYCVPRDSEKGRAVLAELRHRNAELRADRTIDAWRKDRTAKNRAAAIAALQAIEETP